MAVLIWGMTAADPAKGTVRVSMDIPAILKMSAGSRPLFGRYPAELLRQYKARPCTTFNCERVTVPNEGRAAGDSFAGGCAVHLWSQNHEKRVTRAHACPVFRSH